MAAVRYNVLKALIHSTFPLGGRQGWGSKEYRKEDKLDFISSLENAR
jgi:hypothetical protein